MATEITVEKIEHNGASGENEVTIPDNTAIAWEHLDAGGLEYQRVVSTDAQPAVVFNNGEADVDFRVAASGITNAFKINGATGEVGFNTGPLAGSHLYATYTSTIVAGTTASLFTALSAAPAAASAANFYGLYPSVTYTGAGACTGVIAGNLAVATANTNAALTYLAGQWINVASTNAKTPNISNIYGIMINVFDAEDAAVTNMYGIRVPTGSVDAGSIGQSFGVAIFQGTKGAGAITTQYGLYVADMNIGNTNYAIYSAGGRSYHAGTLAVGGTNSVAAQLYVDQSAEDGGIPVLLLDQADLSEEFIEFTTTVGAGNPIDTAALGAYYGKVRVNVTGVGYKVLALYEES